MKFDLVTLYPMHRRCITLISSLLTPSGWVRKPLNYLKVRTGMYRYILLRTNMEFLYCPVPSRTGTYWYVPVRTILPNPVQGYRIPDDILKVCIQSRSALFQKRVFSPEKHPLLMHTLCRTRADSSDLLQTQRILSADFVLKSVVSSLRSTLPRQTS